ncbi:MAG: ISNCY family transposase, partial [bacterium]|nr:ISNCY family transposase [bacterium]
MRQKITPQTNIFNTMARSKIAKELQQISEILDANPEMLDHIYQDLTAKGRSDTGRDGMTAEQVL